MLRRLSEYCRLYAGLSFLGAMCLLWTVLALPLSLLSARRGKAVGRHAPMWIFRFYLRALEAMGACHFDLSELDALRNEPHGLILAPNHPSLLDALMVISKFPNVACVLKSSLMDNIFFGGGARLGRHIRNEPPLRMIRQAVRTVKQGSFLLIFPEGTRTVAAPLNPLKPSIGLIAKHARVPVQTLFIETNSAFLGKGWPLSRRPTMPMRYRVRLGQRFECNNGDSAALVAEIDSYMRRELHRATLRPPTMTDELRGSIDVSFSEPQDINFSEHQPNV